MTSPDKTVVLRHPPVLTVRTLPAPNPRPRTEVMTAGRMERWDLVSRAIKQEQRGEIKRLRRNPVWSHEYQRWELPVRRLKNGPPWWRLPVLASAAAGVLLAGIFWLGWRAANEVTGEALLTFLGAALGGLVLLVWLGRSRHGGGGTVTATAIASVTVKR